MRKIKLLTPYINEKMRQAAVEVMKSDMVGQGPKVDEFEEKFAKAFKYRYVASVNSATAGLELVYHLLNLGPGDEVITPVFTCTATNLALVRRGVKVVFADVKDNLLVDRKDVLSKITPRTKAVINVHLHGSRSDIGKMPVPVVGDAAQYSDWVNDDYVVYSFQATKLFSTGDGGIVVLPGKREYKRAKLLRWYGIDRDTGKPNIMVDIKEAGFKYHMNDITAAMGTAALQELDSLRDHRSTLVAHYFRELQNIPGIDLQGGYGPFLILAEHRTRLVEKLREHGIEAGIMHQRNDIYSVFGGRRQNLNNMNRIEKKYLFLPLHHAVTENDVRYISKVIKGGW